MILGPLGTGPSSAGFAVAARSNVPHVFPWSGVPKIFHPEGSSGTYTYHGDYARATSTGLDWLIKKLNPKRVGILYQDDAFGKHILAGVDTALVSNGLDLSIRTSYKPGDIDFSAQLTKLKAADVDLVVLSTIIRETIGSYTTIRKMSWNVDVVTAIPGRSQIVPLLAKGAMDGLYGIGQWNIIDTKSHTTESETWLTRFQAAYPGMPADNATVSYLMTDWVAQALESAGPDLTVESFNTAMEGSTYKDIFGNAEMTLVNGHITPEVVSVWKVDDSVWRKISDDIKN